MISFSKILCLIPALVVFGASCRSTIKPAEGDELGIIRLDSRLELFKSDDEYMLESNYLINFSLSYYNDKYFSDSDCYSSKDEIDRFIALRNNYFLDKFASFERDSGFSKKDIINSFNVLAAYYQWKMYTHSDFELEHGYKFKKGLKDANKVGR